MSRKQSNTVEYFPHDARASSSDTVTVLEGQFGNDGYAFWFKLLERLASSEGHYLDCRDPERWQLLLARAHITPERGEEIMNSLIVMKAIDRELWELKIIWCQHLVDNIDIVYKNRRREVPTKPERASFETMTDNPITTKRKGITTQSNPQSRVEYSRVNKESIKKEKTLENFNLTEDFRELLFKLWSLPSWEKDISEDIEWLNELRSPSGGWPDISVGDIIACRDWNLDNRKEHSRRQWKLRIRNWMEHKFPPMRPDGGFKTAAEILREMVNK